jgi:hypothetical protein
MTEAQVEGSAIPKVVAIEGVLLEAKALEGATSGPEVPIAPETTEDVRNNALPESSMDVVVRSPEILDAEPICAAPISWRAGASGRRPHRPDDGGSQLGVDAPG